MGAAAQLLVLHPALTLVLVHAFPPQAQLQLPPVLSQSSLATPQQSMRSMSNTPPAWHVLLP